MASNRATVLLRHPSYDVASEACVALDKAKLPYQLIRDRSSDHYVLLVPKSVKEIAAKAVRAVTERGR